MGGFFKLVDCEMDRGMLYIIGSLCVELFVVMVVGLLGKGFVGVV
jgi:hypothetical protein